MRREFLLGELFSGPGGMALGAKLAKPQTSKDGIEFSIKHIWGVDHDPSAIETYNANALGEGVNCDAHDFSDISLKTKHKKINDFKKITALAFGFPCNDYSLVGERKGINGKYGNLYKAGISILELANPDWFIAENVSGINSANSGNTFEKIVFELQNAGKHGYNTNVNLYKFENYGVPQYRHRYLIVGIRKDLKLNFSAPKETHLNNHISAEVALSKPYHYHIYNDEPTKQSERVVKRLLYTPPWKNAWYLDDLLLMKPKERRSALSICPWYKEKIGPLSDDQIENDIIFAKLNCTKARMSHIYKRLHPSKPSYTITGSGGGGTHVYHWEEPRALTNRERARLQGFPDKFIFKGTKENVRKQIGMAVPPSGAKIIFEAILKTFARVSYDNK